MRWRGLVLVALEQFFDCGVGRHVIGCKEVEYLQVAGSLMMQALMVQRQPGMNNEVSDQRGLRLIYMMKPAAQC